MGTVGGNLLQRTRCGYFRDPGFACNKREPGSGCPAIAGDSRGLGVVGVSDALHRHAPVGHAGGVAAMDAALELQAPSGGTRTVPLAEFYRLPGDTPHIETNLLPGELIIAVTGAGQRVGAALALSSRCATAPASSSRWCRPRSASTSQDGMIREVRVALGGVAPKPWRLPQVEAALHGKPLTADALRDAAELAGQGAHAARRRTRSR